MIYRAIEKSPKAFLRNAGAAVLVGMLAVSAGAGAARAQSDNSNATPAQRRACTPDVYRLCAGEIPSVSRITSCLRRKKASLSDACRAVMDGN